MANLTEVLRNVSSPETEAFSHVVAILVPTIFAIVVFVGVVGNLLVVIVVWSNKQMRNTTNILIVSLAMADMLFLVFCVPFTAVSYASTWWPFGIVWCKIVYYLIYVTMYGSVYTLVLMSFDRYLAVVHAIRSLLIRTERNTSIAVAVMWIVILLVNVNALISYEYVEYEHNQTTIVTSGNTTTMELLFTQNRSTCVYMEAMRNPRTAKTFYTCFFLLGFAIPLLFICILYGFMLKRLLYGIAPGGGTQSAESIRSKKRVTKMVVIVVAVFALSWFPNMTLLLIAAYIPEHTRSNAFWALQIFSNCLAYMNSCMNPILYAFLSDNFRKSFRKLLCCSTRTVTKTDNFERTNVGEGHSMALDALNNTRSTYLSKSTLTGHTNGNEITTLINNDL